jgi:hypothetical protein
MAWKTPKYDKSDLNKAGQILKNERSSDEEITNAIEILNNWRAIHSYPLPPFFPDKHNILSLFHNYKVFHDGI